MIPQEGKQDRLVEYHNAPAEQNEPINYSCTTAKFAEQINVPLWKVMECGKYFSSRLGLDVEKVEKIIYSRVEYTYRQEDNESFMIGSPKELATALSQQAKDLIKIGGESE